MPEDEAEVASSLVNGAGIVRQGAEVLVDCTMEHDWAGVDDALDNLLRLTLSLKVGVGVLAKVQAMRRASEA